MTSTPRDANPKSYYPNLDNSPSASPPTSPAYLELAIQKSSNPPAAWLWRPEAEIIGTELHVRVGGSFVWPPPRVDIASVQRVVFVAGGVGIKSVSHPSSSITSAAHHHLRIKLTPRSHPPAAPSSPSFRTSTKRPPGFPRPSTSSTPHAVQAARTPRLSSSSRACNVSSTLLAPFRPHSKAVASTSPAQILCPAAPV